MSEKSTCKTCIHWSSEAAQQKRESHGLCLHPKLGEIHHGSHAYEADALTYPYDEGGHFCTGPDFGCVHHSENKV